MLFRRKKITKTIFMDMNICQQYASETRYRMAKKFLNYFEIYRLKF